MALTASQLEHFRRVLSARRSELASGTVRAEAEVGDQDDLGRADYGDRATATSAKDDLLQEAGRDSELLGQIDAALARIQGGSYGFCTECGQEIPLARLEAVPWTSLCVRDQEILDQKRRDAGTVFGGAPSRVAF
jgi:DnaK suppressor protein